MRSSFAAGSCLLLILGSTSVASAYPDYVSPAYMGAGYECYDCHVHPSGGGSCNASTVHPRLPCLNPFGATYRASGWSVALGNADRDADGFTNLNELTNARSAGFPQGAESVGCNMLTASTFPGSYLACGASFVEVRATYSATGTHNYAFDFRCVNGTSPAPIASDTNWSDRCLDPNECSGNPCAPGSCTQRAVGAGWSAPGYTCSCPAGYAATATGCQLVDACMAGTHTCVAIATCVDTPGSSAVFTCQCPHAGYMGDGRNPGTGCQNINECASNPCGPNGVSCTERPLGSWTAPGYTCTCQTGYVFNGTTCALQNECNAGLADCHPVAICNDPSPTPGDFTCTCPAGYTGTGRGATGCRDVNECTSGLADCDRNATCTNTPGSFTCACNAGFSGNGRTCTDVDECRDPVFVAMCRPNSTCRNTVGSFACDCNRGYRGDGRVACTDIDECRESSHDCDRNALCTNTPGSFSCACNDGWMGNGRTCADVNECADPAFTSRCSTAAMCENLPGDWRCVCNGGYTGDGFECEDLDECADGTHRCHPDATCTNTTGAYSCACREGFMGSGFDCADVDECARSLHSCGPRERCVNRIGMPPLCACLPGFVANAEGECDTACGDGRVGPGETCDDANAADGDGCSALCRIEPGWACFEPTGLESECWNTCGDAFVDLAEECDEGDANSDDAPDACRTTCRLAACGDGVLDSGEACDEGELNSDEAPDACRTSCALAACGDGVVDRGELCDPGRGAVSPAACTTACASPDAGASEPIEPIEDGCSCRAAPPRAGALWLAVLGLLGALVARRRRG
ncbi:MAG: hypothetical protein KF729_18895 [Sandaracinaceae bacterium]|nr:hypothetical protein [Sandaracinaceae bacterium]